MSLRKILEYIVCSVLLFVLISLVFQTQQALCDTDTNQTNLPQLFKLRSDLLKNYDKRFRPVKNTSVTTNVKIWLDIQNVISLDEKNQILTVKGILTVLWTDEFLVWDPNSYGGIVMASFKTSDLWLPPLYTRHTLNPEQHYSEDSSKVAFVRRNGSVEWHPPVIYDIPCSANFRHYPFDDHNCTIWFGLHVYASTVAWLDITPFQNFVNPEHHSEWKIVNVVQKNYLIDYGDIYKFQLVTFNIFLKRTSRIYGFICVIPTLVSLVTTLCGFWLMPHDVSRYMIGCCNIILMSLLLQYLAVTVPPGKDLPLIAEYSASCLCMSAVFLVLSIVVRLIEDSARSPPNGLVRLARQVWDRFLCLSTFLPPEEDRGLVPLSSENTTTITSFEESQKKKDWVIVALVVDRISFWIFVLGYVVLVSALASV